MISTLHLYEHFLFEHHQERQREMEQHGFLGRRPRKQFRLICRLVAMVGGSLMMCSPNLQWLEASREQVAYEH